MFRATPALSLAATQMRLARAPMRVAVVGSGPSGFYAASRLLSAFDAAHGSGPVSYTHLTLPTNREV